MKIEGRFAVCRVDPKGRFHFAFCLAFAIQWDFEFLRKIFLYFYSAVLIGSNPRCDEN